MRRALVALLLAASAALSLQAHDVTPEPIVELFVKPDTSGVDVLVRLPVAALADANLPVDDNGRLVQTDPAALSSGLQAVSQEIARSLDIEQDGDSLPLPATKATVSADGASVDLDLQYASDTRRGNLSAQLRSFRNGTKIIRTLAHYQVADGTDRTFSVTGPPQRIIFDPRLSDALRQFFELGTRVVLRGRDYLLFVLCLVIPLRRSQQIRAAFGVFLIAETIGLLAGSQATALLGAPAPLIAEIVGASAVVVLGLQNIVTPRSRWSAPLAAIFGVASGLALENAFATQVSYAGDHVWTSLFAYLAVIAMGQLWIVALIASASGLVYRWGLPEKLGTLALSIFVVHASLHDVADRSTLLADLGAASFDHFLTVLTLTWAVAVLIAGILEGTIFRPSGSVPGSRPVVEGLPE